jgi:hypothetical protein
VLGRTAHDDGTSFDLGCGPLAERRVPSVIAADGPPTTKPEARPIPPHSTSLRDSTGGETTTNGKGDQHAKVQDFHPNK